MPDAPKTSVTRRTRLTRRGRFVVAGLALAVVSGGGTAAGLTYWPTGEESDTGLGDGSPVASSTADLSKSLVRLKRNQESKALRSKTVVGVPRAVLDEIAECESHGDPRAISSGGDYRGKYQFDRGTWAGVGGKGDPAKAPELEQDYRAALLYKRSGSSPWPVCGS